MRIEGFDWDNKNESHISKHNVLPYEVEEVFYEDTIFLSNKESKIIALGKTFSGRYLFVVFAKKEKGYVRVITSRNMTDREKKYYKKHRG